MDEQHAEQDRDGLERELHPEGDRRRAHGEPEQAELHDPAGAAAALGALAAAVGPDLGRDVAGRGLADGAARRARPAPAAPCRASRSRRACASRASSRRRRSRPRGGACSARGRRRRSRSARARSRSRIAHFHACRCSTTSSSAETSRGAKSGRAATSRWWRSHCSASEAVLRVDHDVLRAVGMLVHHEIAVGLDPAALVGLGVEGHLAGAGPARAPRRPARRSSSRWGVAAGATSWARPHRRRRRACARRRPARSPARSGPGSPSPAALGCRPGPRSPRPARGRAPSGAGGSGPGRSPCRTSR